MKISELKETKIVTNDYHFMPLIFADLPASACAAGAMKLFSEIGKQVKDNKFSIPKIYQKDFYTNICKKTIDIEKLSLSIVDITY